MAPANAGMCHAETRRGLGIMTGAVVFLGGIRRDGPCAHPPERVIADPCGGVTGLQPPGFADDHKDHPYGFRVRDVCTDETV